MTSVREENARRNALIDNDPYDQISGLGCYGDRVKTVTPFGIFHLPRTMLDDPDYRSSLASDRNAFERLRCRHDFEFWAARCAVIRHKLTGRDAPFILNRAQRRLLAAIEEQRLADKPIRVILLKARQWGGSTLVQIYMAWIQTVIRPNWPSLICSHVKDTSRTIMAMYTKLLANYPAELWEGDAPPEFKGFERAANIREIAGRGCRVTLGSSESQEALRGSDIAMAHLSEVAYWKDSRLHQPIDLIRAIVSGIALAPLTMVVMESTANGVGTFFHREWLRAVAGESDKVPVFVAWHEIGIYRADVADPDAFFASLDPYERSLWDDHGLTLEQIRWYRLKLAETADRSKMMAEYPTTPVEAFASTGNGVFAAADVERLRRDCREGKPDPLDPNLRVWADPEPGAPYIVAVDIGGRSSGSDWSVAVVMRAGPVPEVVAQWRGHIDHDLLAAAVERLARRYNMALLVVESNTLESATVWDPSPVLWRLRETYDNLYMRRGTSDGLEGAVRPGFHTNVRTKAAMVATLVAAVRDAAYVERSDAACNELLQYEQLPNGSWAARRGCHDDIVMTRAMALYVLSSEAALPPDDIVRPGNFWYLPAET